MKIAASKWYRLANYIGLCMIITLCASGCQSGGRSIERITQNDMECSVMIQTEWGNGLGELGYVPDAQSSFYPRKPFRFQVDDAGNIYVADLHNERVLAFNSKGVFLKSFSVPMSENGESIGDIAVRGGRIVVDSTNYIYVFDQNDSSPHLLEWPADVGPYGLCSRDMAGRKVQVDADMNIYTCGVGDFESGGTIVQFDSGGHSRRFFAGSFNHFVVGWDGFIYIDKLNYPETVGGPIDSRVLKFDIRDNQVGEIVIRGSDLAEAGLIDPGLLVAVDAQGNLYRNMTNILRDGKVISQEALVQFNAEGKVLWILEYDSFKRPATDVVDEDGNLYLWQLGEPPFGSAEIWRCSP